jgi:hypothetical protein
MIRNIRLLSHHIAKPEFDNPQHLVSHMGAMQAQDYPMVKWAIAMRLKSKKISKIDDAINEGKILRTHIMRPTWHFVSSEDICWMTELSKSRIKAANESRGRILEITEKMYTKVNNLFGNILRDNHHLTKQEICKEIENIGIQLNQTRLNRFLIKAEYDGLICSGQDRKGKPTYALLSERVACRSVFHRDEALAKLCGMYFRSHSPATMEDFAWWSGMSAGDAKKAIDFIKADLTEDNINGRKFYIHSKCKVAGSSSGIVKLLAPFDEYLISYKDRSDVLSPHHYPKAFTRYGIFFPVILYDGKVIGNWKKPVKNKKAGIDYTFFDGIKIPEELLSSAIQEYISYSSPAAENSQV